MHVYTKREFIGQLSCVVLLYLSVLLPCHSKCPHVRNEEFYIHFCADGDDPIHLGRSSSSDCAALTCSSCRAYKNQQITALTSTTFVARIGPSGNERGYIAITRETPLINSSSCIYS